MFMFKKPAPRSTLIAATALFAFGTIIAPQAFAQTAEGSVHGKTTAGTAVTVTSAATGVNRSTTAESNGSFTVSRLPPGRYTVTADGKSVEVLVTIGNSATADFLQELEEIQVTANRQRAIDFTSTESNSTFTQEMIQQLPIPLNVNAVATLTPTVLRGDAGLGDGDLPSFAGSSVAENAYYINGFDVTNIRNFLSYADLPFEAIAQQQVKAGGYGAEYGRSLGGVVSLATKRGTNEWKGGVSAVWTPNFLRDSSKNVLSLEPTQAGTYTVFNKADRRNNTTVNVNLGGPIIQDRLFFFALAQLEHQKDTDFTSTLRTVEESKTPNGMVKLDWNIADGHTFEATGIYNKRRIELYDTGTTARYGTEVSGATDNSWQHTGGTVGIAKYTGAFTDNFTVSVLAGRVKDTVNITKGDRNRTASTCPVVLEVNLDEIGCWGKPFPSTGLRLPGPVDSDKRTAGRVDFEYLLGSHKIRAGVDAQRFESLEVGGFAFSAGHYYRYFVTPASGQINGVAGFTPGRQYVRDRVINSTSGNFEVDNTAYYLEDSWQATERLRLYGGLRAESFNNKNGDGVSFVKQENLIAPRLGFALEVPSDKPTKLYGNAGRYYIPVASNTNIRMTRGEEFTTAFFNFSGRDPVTQGPLNLSARIGPLLVSGDGTLPPPATVADTKLKPMNQDEFILGIQQTQDNGWTLGAKLIYRKLNDGMDDFCGHTPFDNYAADKGYTDFAGTAASCILINPGRDVNLMMDIDDSGTLVEQTVPASYFGLAKYTRTYKALEMTFEKPYNGKWGVGGSYVLSRSKGTGEGYVSSTINQDDAGITQDFDFGSLTDGANGRLPNDRKHVIKAYGNYGITERFSVGYNITALSGRPQSCIGFVPPSVPDFDDAAAYTTASSYYCVGDDGRTKLVPRGTAGTTKWSSTLDLSARYVIEEFGGQGKLTLQADVFNALNSQTPTDLDEVRDFSRQTSSSATGNQQSANYGRPIGFQAPRQGRLTVRYEF